MPSLRSFTNFFTSSLLAAQAPFLSDAPASSQSDLTSIPSVSTNYNDFPSTYDNPTSAPACPIDSPTSCHNSTTAPDSCCFIYPGGQLLQTQFWDTSPSIGPKDSWTLHGLWPDLCDGTYPTYCHSTPQTHSITRILSQRAPALLATMQKYWLPNRGSLENFWQHEFNKHATCINTLAPSCYPEYKAGDEVLDFFTRAVSVFEGLDTYKALEKEGIVPSRTKTYTLVEVQAALEKVTGYEVVVGCSGGRLNQAWYSFNVKGSLQTGVFVAVDPVGKSGRSSCPARGIKYLPK